MGENNKTKRVWETMEEIVERIERLLEGLKGSERKRKLSEVEEERLVLIMECCENEVRKIMLKRDEEKEER